MCQYSCPKDLISSDSEFVLIDAPNTLLIIRDGH